MILLGATAACWSCDDKPDLVDLEVETIYTLPDVAFSVRLRTPVTSEFDWGTVDWKSKGNWVSVQRGDFPLARVTLTADADPGKSGRIEATVPNIGNGRSALRVLDPGSFLLELPYRAGDRPVFALHTEGPDASRAAAGVGAVQASQVHEDPARVVIFSENAAVHFADEIAVDPVRFTVAVDGYVAGGWSQLVSQTNELLHRNRVGVQLTYEDYGTDVSVEADECADIEDDIEPPPGVTLIVLAAEALAGGKRGCTCPAQRRILLDADLPAGPGVLAHELAHHFGLREWGDPMARPWNLMWPEHNDTEARRRESFTLGQLFRMNYGDPVHIEDPSNLRRPISCPQQCPSTAFDLPRGH